MKCERAVIVVGGVGSRTLPWSYANEKCQLPLPDVGIGPDQQPVKVIRAVVDFVIEDCVRAGIRDFTFIIGENAVNTKRAYSGHPSVDGYFQSRGKQHLIKYVKNVGQQITYRFIEQSYGHGVPYGTTYPLALARDVINQPGQTLVVMGDQFFYRGDGTSEAKNLLDSVRSAGDTVTTGMLIREVSADKIPLYGIARRRADGLLDRIVEKPAIGSLLERGANASLYVIDKAIVPYIDRNMTQPPAGMVEHLFTDVLNEFATQQPVVVVAAQGTYVDCGTPDLYETSFLFMSDQATKRMAPSR